MSTAKTNRERERAETLQVFLIILTAAGLLGGLTLLLASVAGCPLPAKAPANTLPDGAPVTLAGACANMKLLGCATDAATCMSGLGNEIDAGLAITDAGAALACIQGAESLQTILQCPGVQECPTP